MALGENCRSGCCSSPNEESFSNISSGGRQIRDKHLFFKLHLIESNPRRQFAYGAPAQTLFRRFDRTAWLCLRRTPRPSRRGSASRSLRAGGRAVAFRRIPGVCTESLRFVYKPQTSDHSQPITRQSHSNVASTPSRDNPNETMCRRLGTKKLTPDHRIWRSAQFGKMQWSLKSPTTI